MHNLSSVYFVKHLYMFRAYLQPIIRRYIVWIKQLVLIVLLRWLLELQPSHDKRQSSQKNNKYQLLYTYGVPPDDGL
jgi:hypothetical protein